ncbi:hypothetical protein RRF57_011439 [Xylaria bambusicola]|uniref:Uncharacterized protein n=1 Tax=Xylaria bambusicola TaxID=326684 RepID=A0AAN7UTT0_9PEZI
MSSGHHPLPGNPAPGEAELWRKIRQGDDPYTIFMYVSVHDLFRRLASWWSGSVLRQFDEFIDSKLPGVCLIKWRSFADPTHDMATELAAYTIARQPWWLHRRKFSPVRVIRERPHNNDRTWDAWTSLVRESIAVLSPLTHGKINVKFDASIDQCVGAIEAAGNSVVHAGVHTNPFRHHFLTTRPILFVSGIDHDWNQRDLEQRAKVQVFISALIRLFRDRAKLIFIVRPDYNPYDPEMHKLRTFVL